MAQKRAKPVGPVLTRMSDVEPQSVDWLWPGKIPAGRITLLVGRPGQGKSFITCSMSAVVSNGGLWPDGTPCDPGGSVLMICAEDDPADTIRPRLDAHGANPHNVHHLDSVVSRTDDDGVAKPRMLSLTDLDALEDALKQLGDCRLVIIDPVNSFIGGGTSANSDNEVRSVLAPVHQLAERYGPAVVAVHHSRKMPAERADDAAMGSRAYVGLARAVWHLYADRQDPERRLLLPGKSNLSRTPTGMAFTIDGDPGRVVWEADPVRMTADDYLLANQSAPVAPQQAEAIAWLQAWLADGPQPATATYQAAQVDGIAKRTLQRAKRRLGVEHRKREGRSEWYLPDQLRQCDYRGEVGEVGDVAPEVEEKAWTL